MSQSDEKLIDVIKMLEAFQQNGEGCTAMEIEERVDFSEDTVRRKLKSLQDRGLVYKKETLWFPLFTLEKGRFHA